MPAFCYRLSAKTRYKKINKQNTKRKLNNNNNKLIIIKIQKKKRISRKITEEQANQPTHNLQFKNNANKIEFYGTKNNQNGDHFFFLSLS